jgi:L-rhamnose mutarotase
MERIAFCLRLRPGTGEAYDKAHREMWPEMLALFKSAGVSEYSIFRRDEMVVLTLRCGNFDETWSRIERSEVDARWQRAMAEFFEPMPPLRGGERFPMMREVFYMP